MSSDGSKAIVTAGTGGIGFETALGLARRGFEVVLVGRDASRGGAAVMRIESEVPGSVVQLILADLSSVAAVNHLGDRLAADGPIRLLINNVGGMFVQRWETIDGIEGSLMLNHLAPMILSAKLIEALSEGAPSRIVNVTSTAITVAELNFDEIESPGEYYGMAATGRAKAMHLVHTFDLAEELRAQGISVFAADPGAAATPNAGAMEIEILPPALRPHWDVIAQGVKTPAADAARSVLFAATDQSLDGQTGLEVGADNVVGTAIRSHISADAAESARQLSRRLRAEWIHHPMH